MHRGSGGRAAWLALLVIGLLAGCQAHFIRTASEPSNPEPDARPTPVRVPAVRPALATVFGGEHVDGRATPSAGRPDDLWQHIAGGLTIDAGAWPEIAAQRRWFIDNPDFLERVTRRARPYLHYIVTEIEARGLPLDLAALPIIESAYRPEAYSRGHAAGVWQFISGTARRFGLKINWWYDGRRDVVASTHAALEYLELLHREFDGDWLLALAAYNCGERRVARALRRNAAQGRPTDFWSLSLPRETRAYVPRLLAVAELIAEPARHGQRLAPVPDRPYFEVVDTGGQIDVEKARRFAKVDRAEFAALNAGHRRWVTDPDGPHRLLVPVARAQALRERIASLTPAERVVWRQHRVRPGETLSQLARRYGTSIAALQRVNELRGTLIRAGSDLLVPPGAGAALTGPAASRAGASRAMHVHRVRRGDTLWEIARAYGVRVADLTHWNGISEREVLHPGRELTIHRAGARASTGEAARAVHYRVRSGDSLWRIARRFDVTVEALRVWNGLPRRGYLQPGQTLVVHLDDGVEI